MKKKPVILRNVKTGEEKWFEYYRKCSDFLSKYYNERLPNTIVQSVIYQPRLFRSEWKIFYEGEEKEVVYKYYKLELYDLNNNLLKVFDSYKSVSEELFISINTARVAKYGGILLGKYKLKKVDYEVKY